MKILITGATGTIGNQVTRALLDEGVQVRVGLRDPAKGAALAALGAQTARFDFQDASTFADAFAGIDRVFLLTPFVESFDVQIGQAARAAKTAGVRFIARMSAFGADPNAGEGLSAQHGRAEEAVKDAGVQWTVIRPTFFQDNVLKYQGAAVAAGAFYGASNGGRIAYVSSKDIADVVAAILRDPTPHVSETYTLTGPEALSDVQVAATLSQTAGRPIAYVDLAPELLLKGQRDAGTPAWMAEHLVALEAVKAAGWAAETTRTVPDILGRPAETFASFVSRHAAQLR